MFSHVMLGANDLEVSKKFYDAVLGTLGIGPGFANKNRYVYSSPAGFFAITTPINGEPATHGNGSTIGFNVDSPAFSPCVRWISTRPSPRTAS